ncbi:MAG: phosphate signaling complex protein PhoU [Rhodovibrionaceae bacterium]
MPGGSSEHIVKSFDEELERLTKTIVRMGGMSESLLASAVEALRRRDSELAAKVVQSDKEIDDLETAISDTSIHMLALRQPMAGDLRVVVSALKISSDLERIGDYAANVAKRVLALNQLPSMEPAGSIPRMARLVQTNIKDVLDAYVNRDSGTAMRVWKRDAEVDEMYTSLFRELLTYMMEDPRNITPCTHLIFIAKNIERIGDHATNIAEVIHFLVEGTTIEEARPKGDTSSFAVVSPEDEQE